MEMWFQNATAGGDTGEEKEDGGEKKRKRKKEGGTTERQRDTERDFGGFLWGPFVMVGQVFVCCRGEIPFGKMIICMIIKDCFDM